MPTKGQIVDRALEAIGIASYVFDLPADKRVAVLRKLDDLMAEWLGIGIDVGYLFPATSGDSTGADDSGLADVPVNAVATNLAVEICPLFGKEPSIRLSKNAERSMNALITHVYVIPDMSPGGNLPVGTGNRNSGRTYFPEPDTTWPADE